MKNISLSILFICFTMMSFSQTVQEIFDDYGKYSESSINDRRFKHSDIEPLITSLKPKYGFEVKIEGASVENRPIYSIKWGNGPVNVLLWSQMHGDEATATMAIFDIIKFLNSSGNDEFKRNVYEKLTLTFIPMLNPDGAEGFSRRNAIGVDLNRDALSLQSPEAKILKNKRDETNAVFGFNLHDQGRVYAAGNNPKQAAISFLAPAYNYEKEVNETRENAMKLISQLTTTLQAHIPEHIAKYSDDFEPRAFGDNIQKWGTSVILIESGGYPEDRDKQMLRKMNFLALLTSFQSIANSEYKNESVETYKSLPFNEKLFFDLLIKNVTIQKEGKDYVVDLAIDQKEISFNGARSYYLRGVIAEVGDLSIYYGYKTIDGTGMNADPGAKVRANDLASSQLFLKTGALFLEYQSNENISGDLPMNIVGSNGAPAMDFKIGNLANLVIRQDGKIKYLILNGFVLDPTAKNPGVYGLDLR